MIGAAKSSDIDEIQKTSYIQCIINTATELNSLTGDITKNMQLLIDRAENKVKIVDDAQDTAEKILSVLENLEKDINRVKSKFSEDYNSWLENILNFITTSSKKQTSEKNVIGKESPTIRCNITNGVVQLEDSNESDDASDIEIVNEIKYLDLPKELSDDNEETLNGKETQNENSACEQENNINETDLVKKTNPKNENSFCDSTVNLDLNNIPVDQEFRTSTFDVTKNQYHLLATKLRLRCVVLLKRLSIHKLAKYKRGIIKSKKSLEDEEFDKLIDLRNLERKTSKRCYISSDSSSLNNSSCSLTTRNYKEKRKKFKQFNIDSSESDVTSYYENSDSCSNNDDNNVFSDDTNFNKRLREQNEERLKQQLLNDSSDIDSSEDFNTEDEEDSPTKCEKKKRMRRIIENSSDSSSNDEEENKKRSSWREDNVLNFKLTDPESDDKQENKKRLKSIKPVESASEHPAKPISHKKKRRRRKRLRSSSSNNSRSSINSSSSNDCYVVNGESQKSEDCQIVNEDSQTSEGDCQIVNGDSQVPESNTLNKSASKLPGRRNIRKLFKDREITEDTKQAGKNEENRLQRLVERKEMLKDLFDKVARKNEDELILDFDIEEKKELISVDKGLVKYLKPHQKDGIKFMWDSCFETVKHTRNTDGSGCILAHSMGLGKTFQIVTLVHTLLTHTSLGIHTVLVVCPMNTVLNWVDEFDIWLKNVENKQKISIIELTQVKKPSSRIAQLNFWHENGGVLILSYDMFRSLMLPGKKFSPLQTKKLKFYLTDPGADLVVCDEGHLLKNEQSLLANKMQDISVKRRIVLTGTPLQNNLIEYHCMVQFVKPYLLGTKVEFQNRFSNPIRNGQFDDSTPRDVKLMKHRAHVLHRMLEGCVQRCDYAVLTPFLPPKQEYVILIRLSNLQTEMYKHFIDNIKSDAKYSSTVFKNSSEAMRLMAHPRALQLKTRVKKNKFKFSKDGKERTLDDYWWSSFIKSEHLEDISISYKLMLLFAILEKCEKEGDKLLVFSQSLQTLDTIQIFLKKIEDESKQTDNSSKNVFNFQGEWKYGIDYFRLDGHVPSEKRNASIKTFNDPANKRARLFLISTRAGGLGINLIGANRVIVFDPSWNPSHDVQSIFRIFRFGQKKPCFIYRFLAAGTMEQKIYERQVTKLSLSLRVVDEQQIQRHYSHSELVELYKYEPLTDVPTLKLPRDHVLADVFLKFRDQVYNFFEHDSLLENKEEEELDEDERKQAWLDYQEEKLKEQNNEILNKNKGKPGPRKRLNIDKTLEAKPTENSLANDTAANDAEQTLELSKP